MNRKSLKRILEEIVAGKELIPLFMDSGIAPSTLYWMLKGFLKAPDRALCRKVASRGKVSTQYLLDRLGSLIDQVDEFLGTNPYSTLNVTYQADFSRIHQSWKELLKEWHPDKKNGGEDSLEMTQRINDAYRVLKEPELREKYDQQFAPLLAIVKDIEEHPVPAFERGGFHPLSGKTASVLGLMISIIIFVSWLASRRTPHPRTKGMKKMVMPPKVEVLASHKLVTGHVTRGRAGLGFPPTRPHDRSRKGERAVLPKFPGKISVHGAAEYGELPIPLLSRQGTLCFTERMLTARIMGQAGIMRGKATTIRLERPPRTASASQRHPRRMATSQHPPAQGNIRVQRKAWTSLAVHGFPSEGKGVETKVAKFVFPAPDQGMGGASPLQVIQRYQTCYREMNTASLYPLFDTEAVENGIPIKASLENTRVFMKLLKIVRFDLKRKVSHRVGNLYFYYGTYTLEYQKPNGKRRFKKKGPISFMLEWEDHHWLIREVNYLE